MNNKYNILSSVHAYSADTKLKHCGYGEWLEEPDHISIEYKGYNIFICRVLIKEHNSQPEVYFGGYLCGYVIIPNTHYYWRKDIHSLLTCHGGITHNHYYKEPEEVHLIGFDCAHLMDFIPTVELSRKSHGLLIEDRLNLPDEIKNHPLLNRIYRNIDYCIEECMGLVDQLIELEDKGKNIEVSMIPCVTVDRSTED